MQTSILRLNRGKESVRGETFEGTQSRSLNSPVVMSHDVWHGACIHLRRSKNTQEHSLVSVHAYWAHCNKQAGDVHRG